MATKSVNLEIDSKISRLFGIHDEYLHLIEKEFNIEVIGRGGKIAVKGEDKGVDNAVRLLRELEEVVKANHSLKKHDIQYAARIIQENKPLNIGELFEERIEVDPQRPFVRPRTEVQKEYIEAIRNYDVVFSIGPAGTGKTYLAVAMAVSSLRRKEVNRIILTRPAVEAGEKLGFLPGDLYEKIYPYLRPLYDALYDMMPSEKVQLYLDRGIIEIAPLAFMRGRTLNDSFIILDEAQNTTSEQMKMFLTRLGFDSRAVITGDITQVDLPKGRLSGLIQVQSILKDVEGIKFIYFTERDVVRHELVQKIVRAYEINEKKDKHAQTHKKKE